MEHKITSDKSILNDKSLNFVDMHHHSSVSDGSKSPEEIARAFIKKGMGVCIADHNQIRGSVYLSRLSKKKKIFTIPAVEVTSNQSKDIVAYFYSINDLESFWENEVRKKIRNNAGFNYNKTSMGIFEILDRIKDYNGVAVLPHPFMQRILGIFRNPKESANLLGNKDFVKKIDCIEVCNFLSGRHDSKIGFLKSLDKPFTAGSDSHIISNFSTLTASHEFEVDSFLGSLLKGRGIVYIGRDSPLRRLAEKAAVLRGNLCIRAPKNR